MPITSGKNYVKEWILYFDVFELNLIWDPFLLENDDIWKVNILKK